jgi:hypothetical protein
MEAMVRLEFRAFPSSTSPQQADQGWVDADSVAQRLERLH